MLQYIRAICKNEIHIFHNKSTFSFIFVKYVYMHFVIKSSHDIKTHTQQIRQEIKF